MARRSPRTAAHRRALAAVATLGIAVLMSLGGALPAAAASVPVITTPSAETVEASYVVEGDVAWSGGTGGSIEVTVTPQAGGPATFCGEATYQAAQEQWSCAVELGIGANTITAVSIEDGETSAASAPVTITRVGTQDLAIIQPSDGARLTSPFTVTGTGPAAGQVTAIEGGESHELCDAAIGLDGTWSCEITAAPSAGYYIWFSSSLPDGSHRDAGLDIVSTIPYTFEPASIGMSVPATPDVLTVEASPVTDPDPGDPSTPYAFGPVADTCTSPADVPMDCAFTGLAPGIWSVFATHDYLGMDNDLEDFVRIPAIPTIAAAAIDGGVRLSGTADPGDLVTARTLTGTDVCSATADTAGDWSCDAAAGVGTHSYRAIARSQGFQVEPLKLPEPSHYGASYDGWSAYSGTTVIDIAAPPEPPVTTYVLGPASIAASAAAVDGADLTVQFYKITRPDPEDPYYYGSPVLSCPETGTEFAAAATTQTCALGDLAPGIWNVYTIDGVDETQSARDDYFRIPDTPTLSATSPAAGVVRFTGTGGAGDRITVEDAGEAVCSATVAPGGTWACETSATPGSHSYRAIAQSQGFEIDVDLIPEQYRDFYVASHDGLSAYTGTRTVTVAAPPPPAAPEPPVFASLVWDITVSGPEDGVYRPGDEVLIEGTGLPDGTEVTGELHSTPVLLGTATAGADGAFAIASTIPADVEPGAHSIVVTATPSGHDPMTLTRPVEIVPAETDAEPDTEPASEEGEEPVAGEDPQVEPTASGQNPRNDLAAPSVLTESIATLFRILEAPLSMAIAGGLALALLFLVAIPTELLGSTLASNSHRLGRGFAAIERATTRVRDWFIDVTRSRAAAAAIFVLVTSIIFGFSDPAFGFDAVSVRLVLSLALAFYLLSYLVGAITGAIVDRVWRTPSVVDIQPAILVFAVLGVLLSRSIGFAPGILIGVVIGLQLLGGDRRARLGAAVIQFGIVVGLSVAAWIGYSLLTAGGSPTDFWSVLLIDTLSAITIEGLTAAMIAIVPLRFLDGRELFDESKALWAGAFIVIAGLFSLLVLPTALEGTEVGDVGIWTLVLIAFAAIAFALWGWFAWQERRAERNTTQRESARR